MIFDVPGRLLPVLAGFGAYGVLRFLRLQRERRLLEDTPTARVRSAAQGYVELRGRARAADTPLLSRLTSTPCAWHSWRVERRRSEGKGDNWELVEQGRSTEQFWLEDDTGRCIVDPEGADVHALNRRRWNGCFGVAAPTASASGGVVLMAGEADHRYTEELILDGDALQALGEFASLQGPQVSAYDELRELVIEWKSDASRRAGFDANRDGELDADEFDRLRANAQAEVQRRRAQRAAEPSTHVLRRPADGRSFVLSSHEPQALQGRLRWQSWAWLVAGCLLLATAGAGFLARG